MKKRLTKRGLSAVIAAVMLLLITIIAAGIIIAFVVPFVRDNLERSSSCFESLNKITFEPTDFNCYVFDGSQTGFSVRIKSDDIVSFRVGLFSSGNSITQDIINGSSLGNIRMLSGDFNEALTVPLEGEVRTYVAQGVFDRVELAPVLKSGEQCDLAENIRLDGCINSQAIELVGEVTTP